MTLAEWCAKHRITQECFNDLLQVNTLQVESDASGSESKVQSLVRLEAAQHGVHLFRNNVGAGAIVDPEQLCPSCQPHAHHVRWGLANDSKRVNTVYKSGDLIGGQSLLIEQRHVGQRMLRFVSRECKHEGWKPPKKLTPRDEAQLRWATFINALGGDAQIVNGLGSFSNASQR